MFLLHHTNNVISITAAVLHFIFCTQISPLFLFFFCHSTFNYWLQLCCTTPTNLKCLASSNRVLLTSVHLAVVLRWPLVPGVALSHVCRYIAPPVRAERNISSSECSAEVNTSTCKTYLLWLPTSVAVPESLKYGSLHCPSTAHWQWRKHHTKKRAGTCVFVCACDCLNLSNTRELQSLNFSEQYVSNPSKQLALHLEHTRIRGLI